MLVHDLDAIRPSFRPDEADAPLVVDPDTVLPRTIASQYLQAVARRSCQVAQCLGVVQLPQLALRDALKVCPDASGEAAVKKCLGVPISEGADHRGYIRDP